MTVKEELRLLLTGRMLSREAYIIIFGCGVAVGAVLALLVWR